jgi:hypothetical protein
LSGFFLLLVSETDTCVYLQSKKAFSWAKDGVIVVKKMMINEKVFNDFMGYLSVSSMGFQGKMDLLNLMSGLIFFISTPIMGSVR